MTQATWNAQSIRDLANQFGVFAAQTEPTPPAQKELDAIEEEVRDWAHGKSRTAVVVPDATRQLPRGMVEHTLNGLSNIDVTIVVATGLHRAPTAAEWNNIPHLAEVAKRGIANVVDRGGFVAPTIFKHIGDVPIGVTKTLVEADGIVVLGAVELHQYAGFSGGVKAVAVGCAIPETIAWIHRPALLKSPNVVVGRTANNPFRQQLSEIVQGLPPIFEVQSTRVNNRWKTTCGAAPRGWEKAVQATHAFVDVPLAQAAVVSMPATKSTNLYQASRGITQLVLQERPPLPQGAPLVLIAEAPEGLGTGTGERSFCRMLDKSPGELVEQLQRCTDVDRVGGGTQRAFVLALATMRHPIAYVSLSESAPLSRFGWHFLRTDDEVTSFLGTDTPLVVPDPIHHLPRLKAATR